MEDAKYAYPSMFAGADSPIVKTTVIVVSGVLWHTKFILFCSVRNRSANCRCNVVSPTNRQIRGKTRISRL